MRRDPFLCVESIGSTPQEPLIQSFLAARQATLRLIQGLEIEEMSLQCADFVSPTKWHLAHTTWFIEKMILQPFVPDYQSVHPDYDFLFNSYYEGLGSFQARGSRGLMARPLLREILSYREVVEQNLNQLLGKQDTSGSAQEIQDRSLLAIHHEHQHQELLLMDIKFNFASQRIAPRWQPTELCRLEAQTQTPDLRFVNFQGGFFEYGAKASDSFSYDNERPAGTSWIQPFALSQRLITQGEYLQFILDGGYKRAELWLSDGWNWLQNHSNEMPLYWKFVEGEYRVFEFGGWEPLCLDRPVSHISYYEADAFARWIGCRLPTEWEWEFAHSNTQASHRPGNAFLESRHYRPSYASKGAIDQLDGHLWQWTSSEYVPYRGYQAFQEELHEYNAKFMCNQKVLKGGSMLTPRQHYRPTYRNFFYPDQAWAATGIRLAKDIL